MGSSQRHCTGHRPHSRGHAPDADHQFGHEKVESLSSLGQVVLLFVTSAWIVYEAINRLEAVLRSRHSEVENVIVRLEPRV